MRQLLSDVTKFHVVGSIPIHDVPFIPPTDRKSLRLRLVNEEVQELNDAIQDRDIVEIADALADIIYVCAGMALEFGIPLADVWDEVQYSNMRKVDPTTGMIKRREDGKILKPDGWKPPDVRRMLVNAGWRP